MSDDIEHLKIHKIASPGQGGQEKKRLPTLGGGLVPDPSKADVDQATVENEASYIERDEEKLRESVLDALRTIFDPEIPINIVELGLIYGVDIVAPGEVEVAMTLTAPACPVAGQLVEEAARRAGLVRGVKRAHVKLVWDPPWTKDRMSDEALLELGLI